MKMESLLKKDTAYLLEHQCTTIPKEKWNHNELLSYPDTLSQMYFGEVKQAWNLEAKEVEATIYFGSPESDRQIQETSKACQQVHELGLFTILWCYLINDAFKYDKDYSVSAELTGQVNHLGVPIKSISSNKNCP